MKKDQFKSIFLKVDFFKGVNMYKVLLFSVFISSCFSFITALLPLFVLPIFEMNIHTTSICLAIISLVTVLKYLYRKAH